MARPSLYKIRKDGTVLRRRLPLALLALTLLAAAPADRIPFEFDERIPLENRRILEAELAPALQTISIDGNATVIISLRVIEPGEEPSSIPTRDNLLAEAREAVPREAR